MNMPAHTSSRSRPAARVAMIFGTLALVAGTSARAETAAGTALKNTAIVGTVATWAYAFFKGAPFGSCLLNGSSTDDHWGARVAAGKDAELKYASVGLERHECALTDAGPFSLDVSPVAAVGAWRADSGSQYAHRAWDFSYVPMMHWRTPVSAQTRLDFEFGIGPAYLSEANIGNRQKSTNFQFSDHFGIGLSSADGHWRGGFAFRHISNLSIQTPNRAVDFKGVALEWTP